MTTKTNIVKKKESKSFDGYTRFYEHESKFTKTKMRFSSFEPAQKTKKALIWLSGLTCNEENFITKAGAQKYLAEHNLMVICPDTSPRGLNLPEEHDEFFFGSGAGFYADASTEGYRDHYQMYSYINEEIYSILKNEFGIQEISIFGHSMGGHGAILFVLRNPDKYKSVSAFAPVVNPHNSPWGQFGIPRYFVDAKEALLYDSLELVKAGYKYPKQILVDQGSADEFLDVHIHMKDFEQACKEAGQEIIMKYREGYDHGYFYISSFIEEHIKFHAEMMTAKS